MTVTPRRGPGWLPAVTAAAAVLLLALAAAGLLQSRLSAGADQRRSRQTAVTAVEVTSRLRAAGDLATAVAALEASSEQVTTAEFEAFLDTASRRRPVEEAYDGVVGVLVLEGDADRGFRLRHGRHRLADIDAALDGLRTCGPCPEIFRAARRDDGVLDAVTPEPQLAATLGADLLVVEALAAGTRAPAGWIVLLVDTTRLAADAGPAQVRQLEVAGDDTARADATDSAPQDTEVRRIRANGTVYALTLTPPAVLLTPTERLTPGLIAVSGAIIAALLGALVHATGSSRRRAEAAVVTATTEQRLAYEQLATANRQLARANAELERFAGVVAHDLRAPLTHIQGLIEAVRSGRASSEQTEVFLDRAAANTERLEDLVAQLLDYAVAGRTIGDPEPVELDAVVAQALERLTATIDELDGRIEVEPLPAVTGDAERLTQVVQNLVANALTHAGPGTRVRVTATRVDDRIRLTIADDGPGVAPEDRDQVRNAFERGRSPAAGTGLGLATVTRIVAAHGGTTVLGASDLGGLAVTLELPAA